MKVTKASAAPSVKILLVPAATELRAAFLPYARESTRGWGTTIQPTG